MTTTMEQFLAEAGVRFELEIEAYKKPRGHVAESDWTAAFEYALDRGNPAKTAAQYADAHAEAFPPGKWPEIRPEVAEHARRNAIEQLAQALAKQAESQDAQARPLIATRLAVK